MKRKINAIVVHCSATPNGKPITIADIDAMHKARGFKRDSQAARNARPELRHVGYHFVIEVDGSVHPGRGLEEIGAHVQGSNAKSVGICMIGTDAFTASQWGALRGLLMTLAESVTGRPVTGDHGRALTIFKDAGITIKGHRDFSPDLNGNGVIERNEWLKICPGFSVAGWIDGGMEPLSGHILEASA